MTDSFWLIEINKAMLRAEVTGFTDFEHKTIDDLNDLYDDLLLVIEKYHACNKTDILDERQTVEILCGVLGRFIQEHSDSADDMTRSAMATIGSIIQSGLSQHRPIRRSR